MHFFLQLTTLLVLSFTYSQTLIDPESMGLMVFFCSFSLDETIFDH